MVPLVTGILYTGMHGKFKNANILAIEVFLFFFIAVKYLPLNVEDILEIYINF